MSTQQELDAANARILARRSRLTATFSPGITLDLSKVAVLPDQTCVICHQVFGGDDGETVCGRQRCVDAARAREWAALPKSQLLRGSGVPTKYRIDFDLDFHGGEWPADYRGQDDAGSWAGEPPTVTLAGTNHSGKSTLAAEMLFRCIRAREGRLQSAYWVRPSELISEERQTPLGQPRPQMSRARGASVLVVDDFGWDMSDHNITLIAELCEHRQSKGKPTIWTTHRPIAKGEGCIKDLAPMIFVRLATGLVINIERGASR